MANKLFDLPETKGKFQLKGIVSGTESEKFYKEIITKTGKQMRMINFGMSYNEGKTLYINLQGMEQDYVYFSKRSEAKGQKSITEKIPWEDRLSFNKEGFRMIGVNVGVKKKIDSKGEQVNDKKVLHQFDACGEVAKNLKDDMSVFVRGQLDYSSKIDDNGNKRIYTKLVPNQISLCAPIDFDAENYNQQNDFNQVIVFVSIEPEKEDEKSTGRYILLAKIVTYNNIEDVQFIVENKNLALKFKKALKPYNSIQVSGHMVSSTQINEVVEDDDDWGEHDAMERVSTPTKREFIVTGAKGSTLDRETYTEENIEAAIAAIRKANKAENDFGGSDDDWGDLDNIKDEDNEPW